MLLKEILVVICYLLFGSCRTQTVHKGAGSQLYRNHAERGSRIFGNPSVLAAHDQNVHEWDVIFSRRVGLEEHLADLAAVTNIQQLTIAAEYDFNDPCDTMLARIFQELLTHSQLSRLILKNIIVDTFPMTLKNNRYIEHLVFTDNFRLAAEEAIKEHDSAADSATDPANPKPQISPKHDKKKKDIILLALSLPQLKSLHLETTGLLLAQPAEPLQGLSTRQVLDSLTVINGGVFLVEFMLKRIASTSRLVLKGNGFIGLDVLMNINNPTLFKKITHFVFNDEPFIQRLEVGFFSQLTSLSNLSLLNTNPKVLVSSAFFTKELVFEGIISLDSHLYLQMEAIYNTFLETKTSIFVFEVFEAAMTKNNLVLEISRHMEQYRDIVTGEHTVMRSIKIHNSRFLFSIPTLHNVSVLRLTYTSSERLGFVDFTQLLKTVMHRGKQLDSLVLQFTKKAVAYEYVNTTIIEPGENPKFYISTTMLETSKNLKFFAIENIQGSNKADIKAVQGKVIAGEGDPSIFIAKERSTLQSSWQDIPNLDYTLYLVDTYYLPIWFNNTFSQHPEILLADYRLNLLPPSTTITVPLLLTILKQLHPNESRAKNSLKAHIQSLTNLFDMCLKCLKPFDSVSHNPNNSPLKRYFVVLSCRHHLCQDCIFLIHKPDETSHASLFPSLSSALSKLTQYIANRVTGSSSENNRKSTFICPVPTCGKVSSYYYIDNITALLFGKSGTPA
ncbi:hypothetical protein NEHOM01_1753 [Nematocida homosporus]|uniref:uncharacterized protein n=1 Tax=Nematocida homosporus TaxID=1912981 RepID=UPI00221FB9FD|nr:uncharacterized protein NEHOM01_1753 [Nematocida homosporus]KAI5186858.1 hypothetical protein NEHOM01_1753 [Nematocida homosporus]